MGHYFPPSALLPPPRLAPARPLLSPVATPPACPAITRRGSWMHKDSGNNEGKIGGKKGNEETGREMERDEPHAGAFVPGGRVTIQTPHSGHSLTNSLFILPLSSSPFYTCAFRKDTFIELFIDGLSLSLSFHPFPALSPFSSPPLRSFPSHAYPSPSSLSLPLSFLIFFRSLPLFTFCSSPARPPVP